MSVAADTTHSEALLAQELDRRDLIQRKFEALAADIKDRDNSTPTEADEEQFKLYRMELAELDTRIDQRSKDVEATKTATENAAAIRRMLANANGENVEVTEEGIVYRDFATYAFDEIITRTGQECSKIAQQAGGEAAVLRARERLQMLKRTPANTLSSNVGGLTPPQFIDQIFQVINKSRPLVDAAPKTALVRGTLTYPKVSQRPLVAVQASEKSEAGNQAMHVDLQTATASTYLGGGDLSWQAINWSTPDALQLWFDLAAADYALKTEVDAATTLRDSAFAHIIGSPLGASPTFAQLMTAIGAGYSAVYANSGRTANSVIMAPDFFGALLGLTSNAFTQFTTVDGSHIGPLNVVISRGLDAGVAVVGDIAGFLVAETAGAPVELRVVEPAIGGVEVGIIGAFEAQVVDDGAFALITTAS